MDERLSPKQVARAIGVSEASLKRWCDKGWLDVQRTAGVHRRIRVGSVLRFLREREMSLVKPEVLGLPASTGSGTGTLERARRRIKDALVAGDEEQFRAATFDLYLAGVSLCAIGDAILAPTFQELGSDWERHAIDVYQERRACEICMRWLHEIGHALPPPPPNAFLAIGSTLERDPYTLPTTLAELVLRQAGWRASSYGTGLPVESLQQAIRDVRPRLVWVSFSTLPDNGFVPRWRELIETAQAQGTAVIIGGRALTDDFRQELSYTAHGDRMAHLRSFAATLQPKSDDPSRHETASA